jgi:serine/threonine-protein kinase
MADGDLLRAQIDARIGLVLKSKWRLDSLIGIGGMAAVYAATHRNAKRVAVKMLHPEVSIDDNIRQRFIREGYAANRVGHPGAVDILDDDIAEDGSAFLVMELLDGENLDRRMRRKGGRLDVVEVLSVADQVLDILEAAHERGILHRDIKPENVFLTRNGTIKLLDFGIARVLELAGSSKVTQRGAILGTPSFMAPEQAMAIWDDVDPRSDIWALGATLFMLLTGDFVHPAASGLQALDYAVNKRARSVSQVRPELAPSVVALIDRSLAFEKAQRYPSAREMQDDVRAAYKEIEADLASAELAAGEDEALATTESVSTSPAPDPEAAPQEPDVQAYDVEPEPPSIAASTIASKKKKSKMRTRGILALLAAAVVGAGAAILSRSPSPGVEPIPSATASAPVGTAGVHASADTLPEPNVTPNVTEPAARSAMPSASAPSIPVIAASALPPEEPPVATAVKPPPATARPRASASSGHASTPPPAYTEPPAQTASAAPADPFSGRF